MVAGVLLDDIYSLSDASLRKGGFSKENGTSFGCGIKRPVPPLPKGGTFFWYLIYNNMRSFRDWLESNGNLLKLYDMLMMYYKGSSPWKNRNYHYALVQSLQDAGFPQDAAELSRLEPTPEEMEYANRPMWGIGGGMMNMGSVLAHKNNQNPRMEDIFSMKHSDYSHKVEELLDRLNAQGIGLD